MTEDELNVEIEDSLQIAALRRELEQARADYIEAKSRYESALVYEPLVNAHK